MQSLFRGTAKPSGRYSRAAVVVTGIATGLTVLVVEATFVENSTEGNNVGKVDARKLSRYLKQTVASLAGWATGW